MYKSEYPRPQLEREKWLNLNGTWEFDFDDNNIGLKEKWFIKHQFNKKIEVPFCYQSKLSGINDLTPHDYVWYKRTFEIPKDWKESVVIHFGAVDYKTNVYINGQLVGTHTGGSDSFSFDITNFLTRKLEEIVLYVFDPSFEERIPRGKQTWTKESHGIWYTRTTGIWQTVWLEPLCADAIDNMKITPLLDNGSIDIKFATKTMTKKNIRLRIYDQDNLIVDDIYLCNDEISRNVKIWGNEIFKTNLHHHGKSWTPENPFLYNISVDVIVNGKVVDSVDSYFGMRKIQAVNGMIYLNNRPYYLKLVLDQGYHKDGLLTAPSDEDLLNDIKYSKEMGFNGCRKHQKIEEERFLYHADKLGFLVWEELPSTASFDHDYHASIICEWANTIKRDYNHPSIIVWVPLNESWGVPNINNDSSEQNYALSLYNLTKSLDPTRLVVSNDGWEQVSGDICAVHNYAHGHIDDLVQHKKYRESIFDKLGLLNGSPSGRNIYANGFQYQDQPILLTEFGGISYVTEQKGWGYSNVTNNNDFLKEYKRILTDVNDSTALAGFCYTQLTDVEQETNGLLTYCRKVKIPLKDIKDINDFVRFRIPIKKS